jgi:SAM-dependent methyltransferase
MDIRKTNNVIKRDFLNEWVTKGSFVLDVGCGQGGDLHKWRHLGVTLFGIDPSTPAIQEAIRRSKGYGTFDVGTIQSAPPEQFDVICYNFSLQYQSIKLFHEITNRLRPGGLLLGIVTDSTRISESLANGIHVEKVPGDSKISVWIPDTPYYANGPVTEPILDREVLIREAEKNGLKLLLWDPFSIYAKFVFKYNK